MKQEFVDLAVVGGSLGGVLCAYSAAKQGIKVLLFEESDWIGGQLTAQAVPPDEHRFIETTGCTASYRAYRNAVREHYRNHPFIADELKTKEFFCPAGSSVSRLSHPPKLALKLLEEMLEPFISTGRLTVYTNAKAISAEVSGDTVKTVLFSCGGEQINVAARYFADGTDTGYLLKLTGTEYRVGAESRSLFNEPHAPECGDPCDMQPVTWSACVENMGSGDYTIDRPQEYEFFRALKTPYDDKSVLSMYGPDSATGKARLFGMYDGEIDSEGNPLFALFPYRRIIKADNFKDGYIKHDVTIINWPQNDYFLGNIFDTADDEYNRYMARQLTLSLVYYLQTEANCRSFRLAGEHVGTADGLTKAPYIRESRRLESLRTVTENDVKKGGRARFNDSVGIGSYPIDLHITTVSHTFLYAESEPFTIPLGAFIPVRMANIIPACKNIGATHLTNGCYRLHPVEWNIGESAGLLAAYCSTEKLLPREVYYDSVRLSAYQKLLTDNGISLFW